MFAVRRSPRFLLACRVRGSPRDLLRMAVSANLDRGEAEKKKKRQQRGSFAAASWGFTPGRGGGAAPDVLHCRWDKASHVPFIWPLSFDQSVRFFAHHSQLCLTLAHVCADPLLGEIEIYSASRS